MNIKLDSVDIPNRAIKAIKIAIQKQFPSASLIHVDDDSIQVWFDTDPGIGPKLNPKAYGQRLETLKKELASFVAASGKTLEEIIADITKV
jgi:hypothetical protein